MAMAVSSLKGRPVYGWHVHGGELWVELADRGVLLACECGRGHLLPRVEPGQVLLVKCHSCGTTTEMLLSPGATLVA